MKFVQRSLHPYLVYDCGADKRDGPIFPPACISGKLVRRTVEVFNGGLSGNKLVLRLERALGQPDGPAAVAGGEIPCEIEPGFHATRKSSSSCLRRARASGGSTCCWNPARRERRFFVKRDSTWMCMPAAKRISASRERIGSAECCLRVAAACERQAKQGARPCHEHEEKAVMNLKCSLLTMLALSGTLQAAEDLKIKFDERGIGLDRPQRRRTGEPGRRAFRGSRRRVHGSPRENGVRRMWQPKPTKSAFDAATKTLLQEYDWGKAACVFAAKENRLDLRIALTNASATTDPGLYPVSAPDDLAEPLFQPFRLLLPGRRPKPFPAVSTPTRKARSPWSIRTMGPVPPPSSGTAAASSRASACVSPARRRSEFLTIRSWTTSISPRPDGR